MKDILYQFFGTNHWKMLKSKQWSNCKQWSHRKWPVNSKLMLPQFVCCLSRSRFRPVELLILSVILSQWKFRKKYKRFRENVGELSENRDQINIKIKSNFHENKI